MLLNGGSPDIIENSTGMDVCVYIGSFRSPSHWLLGVASIKELDDDTEADVLRKQELQQCTCPCCFEAACHLLCKGMRLSVYLHIALYM